MNRTEQAVDILVQAGTIGSKFPEITSRTEIGPDGVYLRPQIGDKLRNSQLEPETCYVSFMHSMQTQNTGKIEREEILTEIKNAEGFQEELDKEKKDKTGDFWPTVKAKLLDWGMTIEEKKAPTFADLVQLVTDTAPDNTILVHYMYENVFHEYVSDRGIDGHFSVIRGFAIEGGIPYVVLDDPSDDDGDSVTWAEWRDGYLWVTWEKFSEIWGDLKCPQDHWAAIISPPKRIRA